MFNLTHQIEWAMPIGHLGTSEHRNIMSRINPETQGLLNALRQKMAGLKLEVVSIFYVNA